MNLFPRCARRAALIGGATAGAAYTYFMNEAKSSSWPSAPKGTHHVYQDWRGRVTAVKTPLNYQERDAVTPSLERNGKVGTNRDLKGSDSTLYGTAFEPTSTNIVNARLLDTAPSLNVEGFALLPHNIDRELGKDFDFYDNESIIRKYYPSIEKLVKAATGASHVYAFDHNVRCAGGKKSGKSLKGGNSVQGPAHIVHTDYTLNSSEQRLRDLSGPAKVNDTWRLVKGEKEPLIPPTLVQKVTDKKEGKWAMINVWRNIKREPVQRFPLAVVDSRSVDPEDLVTFEIHYSDRVGENYFIRNTPKQQRHKWHYFPQMVRDEALVFKQWDSTGKLQRSKGKVQTIQSTTPQFVPHSAIDDPTTSPKAPDRESIEVRCVLIFADDN
mmetsp:Transcript_16864/g.25343  ORF Transcript_16864/g.25343 Transcript_16864/m.25343 type:complete len:383 (+) Transcript_16864:92-1240(+)